MLINLIAIVHGGIIDNTQRGITKLTLYTEVERNPVQMSLEGDCLGEAAGRQTIFMVRGENKSCPEPNQIKAYRSVIDLLKKLQDHFIMGDIAVLTRGKKGTSGDELVIEFFHGRETRFLIECAKCACKLSPCAWKPEEADGEKQKMLNLLALRHHVAYNARYFNGPTMQSVSSSFPFCKWDYVLNCAEGYNTIAQTVWHKYPDTPYGRLRVAFVLNLIKFHNRPSSKEKKKKVLSQKKPIRMPERGQYSFTDFLLPQENALLVDIMKKPLYKASFDFFKFVQKELIKRARNGQNDAKAERIYTDISSLFGHSLATMLLLAEDEKELDVVQKRSHELLKCCKKLNRLTAYCDEGAREIFSNSLLRLQEELQIFISSLEV